MKNTSSPKLFQALKLLQSIFLTTYTIWINNMFFPTAYILGYILKNMKDERKNKAKDLTELKSMSESIQKLEQPFIAVMEYH